MTTVITQVASTCPVHLGRYIAKSFPQGCFIGKVVTWNNPYFLMVFSDWDEEDYTEKELLKYIADYIRLAAQEQLEGGLIAEQQPVVDDVAVKWLKARDSLLQLALASEYLEASGNQ
jgi:hypothetical protein